MEIGGATDRDTTREVFLFRSGATLRGVSNRQSGSNLPPRPEPWVFEKRFLLAINRVMPFRHDPEPIVRGLEANGFYVWDSGNVNKGEGSGT